MTTRCRSSPPPTYSRMYRPSAYLIALVFGAAGTAHFVWPSAFARIVPPISGAGPKGPGGV
jgi:hypothetical protein